LAQLAVGDYVGLELRDIPSEVVGLVLDFFDFEIDFLDDLHFQEFLLLELSPNFENYFDVSLLTGVERDLNPILDLARESVFHLYDLNVLHG